MIINSVAQYFPNVHYLVQVLREAVRITRRGGHIFIGDVRSLPLMPAYYASVQLYRQPPEMPVKELRRQIRRMEQAEEELLIDPALFEELGRQSNKTGRVEIAPKTAAYDNELSRFRYDVTLTIGGKERMKSRTVGAVDPRGAMEEEAGACDGGRACWLRGRAGSPGRARGLLGGSRPPAAQRGRFYSRAAAEHLRRGRGRRPA